MSPFHNEHIAFRRVKEVMEACRLTGISVLPRIENFFNAIDSFDDRVPHKLDEYVEVFGPDYIANIPRRYWVHFGGRALKTYERLLMLEDLQTIISSNPGGCREITDVSHFHIDLFGNYIPGLCSGLAVRLDDLGSPLFPEKYPILSTLFHSGINGLFQTAVRDYCFEPRDRYLSKCHLCTEIRRWLVLDRKVDSPELQPLGFSKTG
jgi:hypothetical protein